MRVDIRKQYSETIEPLANISDDRDTKLKYHKIYANLEEHHWYKFVVFEDVWEILPAIQSAEPANPN